jgi:hypothetical protein
VDQPEGLTYRELQDIRFGVRKRLNKEHVAFGELTAGGRHKPGGCGVLGMEDGTATILADGTLVGHGIVWDTTSRLWCSTVADGTATGDWTLVKLHPSKQWGGQDVTWLGAQQFDATCEFTSIQIDGSCEISARLTCYSKAEFTALLSCYSGVDITGFLRCSSSAYFTNDVSMKADCVVDGTLVSAGRLSATGDASHDAFASAWGWATLAAGLVAGYNVTRCDRTSAGKFCVSFTANLASGNYAAQGNAHYSSAGELCIPYSFCHLPTGFYMVFLTPAGAAVDPSGYSFAAFGG